MATNFREEGEVKDWTNDSGAAVVSGQVVKMANTLGIAIVDIATSAVGAVRVCGVWTVPKVTTTVWTVGAKLLWDVSAAKFDVGTATPAAGDVLGAAVAWKAGANGETTGEVLLTPGNTVVT